MNEKPHFGAMAAETFQVGDIVEWSRWDSEIEDWAANYGIVMSIENQMKSNRLVSVSKVLPLNASQPEIEFFTLSLRLVSKNSEILKD